MTEFYCLDKALKEEMANHIKENGVADFKTFLEKKLNECGNTKIQFAVTGNSGAGKSAFINAIRG